MIGMSTPKKFELLQALEEEVRRFLAAGILFNERVAAELGLNGTDLQCLNLLELEGSATPGDIARWSGLTTGGVTVAVDRLEKAGYVQRQPNPADRRSTIVRPVKARFAPLHAIYKSKGELLAGVLSGFDQRQLELILGFFRKTRQAEPDADSPRKRSS